MINWELYDVEGYPDWTKGVDDNYEKGWMDCIEKLKSAEKLGEICKPLSVEEIGKIMCKRCEKENSIQQCSPMFPIPKGCKELAEAIHRAMTNKDNK